MKTLSKCRRALIGLGFVAVIGYVGVGSGSAGVRDSIFFISPDGSVAFDVRDVSRREVLDRLLAGKAIELEWVDAGFADEKISGAFKGSADSVLQRLLAQSDYVAVYDRKGDNPRIARLIIVGKASSQSKSAPPSLSIGSPPPADAQALALKPMTGPADFTPPSAADQAITLIRPPPAGMTAPPLVPPSPAEAAHPLFVPPAAPKR